MIFALVNVIVEGYLLVWRIESLYDGSTVSRELLYTCPWVCWNNKNRKALLITLTALQPLRVRSFGGAVVNNEYFKEVLKTVYSIVAVAVKFK
ncbi:uncharacterized protein LOC126890002 [Diabrotica virgifera virgifera]|uniref:Uncharacterized protein n=1 Tax=Diabrotica virgifera virgifera TaxID=50390 RepID=A0ABM5KX47_DIAVI|nr:uncharacterized protein LOC126890002 [Diabrotica virgifera virgifera]